MIPISINLHAEENPFVGLYQINGNILTIQVIKQYAQRLLPVQQWNQMTAFLDAAYAFSISKIVMKKVK